MFPLRSPEFESEPRLEHGSITVFLQLADCVPFSVLPRQMLSDWTLAIWILNKGSFLPRHCLLRLTHHSAKKIQTFPLFSYPVTDFFKSQNLSSYIQPGKVFKVYFERTQNPSRMPVDGKFFLVCW